MKYGILETLRTLRSIVVILGTFLGAWAAETAAGDLDRVGTCIIAALPDDVILPGGRDASGGAIRICLSRRLSPGSGLHETTVDGAGSLLVSDRITRKRDPLDRGPVVILRRLDEGRFALYGYATPVGDRTLIYRLRDPRASPLPKTRIDIDMGWPTVTDVRDRSSGFTLVAAMN